MKITLYKCDICGKESDPDEMLHTEDGKDVCVECLESLVKKHFAKMEEILESACAKEPVPHKAENYAAKTQQKVTTNVKKTQQKKEVDWGKAQALRDAGWAINAIAREIGSSWDLVNRHTHKPEPKKSKPHEWTDAGVKRIGSTDQEEIEELMHNG